MKNLLILTEYETKKSILIGTQQIINVTRLLDKEKNIYYTQIKSVGAMIETKYVVEDVDYIYSLYNS